MKSFNSWIKEDENYRLRDMLDPSCGEKAYNAGAENKEKEMLQFSEWLSPSPHDRGLYSCGNVYLTLHDAFKYWKDNVKGNKNEN